MRQWIGILILIVILIAAGQVKDAFAEVVIKIRALNPLNSKETAVINYPLPEKIKESDIIRQKITYSLDHSEDEEPPKQSFNISFNEQKGFHYVDDEVVLLPKEVVTLEVHVKDVWVINQAQIEDLKQEVNSLLEDWEEQLNQTSDAQESDMLEGELAQEKQNKENETKEFALTMKNEILDGLDTILNRQNSNKIIDVGVEKHITAYEDNIEELLQVQQDIVLLANLIEFEGEEEQPEQEVQPEEEQNLDS